MEKAILINQANNLPECFPVKCPAHQCGQDEGADGNNLPMFQPLSLNDQPVEVVECFKYLGTQIDDKLSFTERVFLIR